MENLNTRVGWEQDDEMVDKYGFGLHKGHWEKWLHLCAINGQIMTNTYFEDHPR